MKRKITRVPPLCEINTDKLGTHYGIERDGIGAPVTLWWDRSLREEEILFIRQENGAETADVVMLTLSQVYAAIDALNRAIMSK